MKAIVIHKYGGPEELQFEDYADPFPGPGEVLVRITATSINPFDMMRRSGAAKAFAPIEFPGIVGVDLSGAVVKVGPGVQGFSTGDHVFGMADRTYAELCIAKASKPCGDSSGARRDACSGSSAGHDHGKPIDLGRHWN